MDLHLERRDFRAMIFYDFMRKLSPKESHIQLQDTSGEKSPSLATVYNWHGEFNRGRNTLSDEMRSGRPADAVNPENIQKVKKIIKNERRIIIDEIMRAFRHQQRKPPYHTS
ncbi:Histone-lysine N-methyltransferase SETMAR [Oopsacas minuta]|uniref:Histone-lysine N-methyltransferase SETMAR n=1 Tax=Oopsacas minuta TaxID=111878 RepID=A0AAV7KJC1_9METZ|nr:Histone-lysine N-methyltransferase SETMAR [Oopsacas minuta]